MNNNDFLRNLNPINKYNEILGDIKNYNRADTVNMSENEMNKFRHIAGPAYLTSQYYPKPLVRSLGYMKEIKDLFQGRGLSDTLQDLKNNETGIVIGEANRNIQGGNQKTLFDYIFHNHIKSNR